MIELGSRWSEDPGSTLTRGIISDALLITWWLTVNHQILESWKLTRMYFECSHHTKVYWDNVHAKCWCRNSIVCMYIHENILLCTIPSMFMKHQWTSESCLITSWDGGDIDKSPALCEAVTKAAQFKGQHFVSCLLELFGRWRETQHTPGTVPAP